MTQKETCTIEVTKAELLVLLAVMGERTTTEDYEMYMGHPKIHEYVTVSEFTKGSYTAYDKVRALWGDDID